MLSCDGAPDVDQATNRLIRSREHEVARFQALQSEPGMSLSGLSVAVREISVLAERLNGAPS